MAVTGYITYIQDLGQVRDGEVEKRMLIVEQHGMKSVSQVCCGLQVGSRSSLVLLLGDLKLYFVGNDALFCCAQTHILQAVYIYQSGPQ